MVDGGEGTKEDDREREMWMKRERLLEKGTDNSSTYTNNAWFT